MNFSHVCHRLPRKHPGEAPSLPTYMVSIMYICTETMRGFDEYDEKFRRIRALT